VSVEALRELAEKVEDGDAEAVRELIVNSAVSFPPVWLGVGRIMEGSLDAAKALHEAVLPRQWYGIHSTATGYSVAVHLVAGPGVGIYRSGDGQKCPARAWLLAILKALIAQEVGQ
jgi:hypothetical protein